ncbi:MAG: hypothetical protein ACRDGA_00825, partial [Bacteroidota bacterium]
MTGTGRRFLKKIKYSSLIARKNNVASVWRPNGGQVVKISKGETCFCSSSNIIDPDVVGVRLEVEDTRGNTLAIRRESYVKMFYQSTQRSNCFARSVIKDKSGTLQ